MTETFVTYEELATDHSVPWTVLLLHGTGGSERDLIPLGRSIAPGARLLGIRGQISEQGAARFFRRFGEGQLDLDDLRIKAIELAAWLRERIKNQGDKPERFMIVGYSNGANMGTGLLQVAPELFIGAILIRAMWSLSIIPPPQLDCQHILLINGLLDQMIPSAQVTNLGEYLASCGATVRTEIVRTSHGLSEEDVELSTQWLAQLRA